ncbi:MFS transporter [Xanthobacteraceae bacterium A53D]
MLVVAALLQLVCWGTASLLAIIGVTIAADLKMDVPTVFAGNSVFYCVMGLCGPLLGRAFVQQGARRVMMAGMVVAAPGYMLLALAQGPWLFFAGWVLIGASGAATLATAAAILLHEIAGVRAQRAIGAMMLATGLANSLFWPLTAVLTDLWGWRATCWIFAALPIVVCLPLLIFGLPRRVVVPAVPVPADATAAPDRPDVRARSTFLIMMGAIAINGFVVFGFNSVIIELLKAENVRLDLAVAIGSALGVVQVSARLVDFLGGGRWDGLTTGLWASVMIVLAPLIAMLGGASLWVIGAFVLVYGLGSGAFQVARNTIPLVFYDQATYVRAMSAMALPFNVACAVSPPLFMMLLIDTGVDAVLAVATACSACALFGLVLLRGRRPRLRGLASISPAGRD